MWPRCRYRESKKLSLLEVHACRKASIRSLLPMRKGDGLLLVMRDDDDEMDGRSIVMWLLLSWLFTAKE